MIFRILYKLWTFLLPSFITSHFGADEKPSIVHSTAWLDGLRGWAAVVVFFHHTHYLFFNSNDGWHFNEKAVQLWRLPVIHSVFMGHTAVSVFFVVSGFTLSLQPVKLMQNGDSTKLFSILSSAAIRRPFRLYGPLIVSTFLVFMFGRLGAFAYSETYIAGFLAWSEYHYKIQRPEFWLDFWLWLKQTLNFCTADIYHWTTPMAKAYVWDPHLWTIPVEFRCSMTLYLTQLAVGRMKSRMRLSVLIGLTVLSVFRDWWGIQLFWAGMILCELYTLHSSHAVRALPVTSTTSTIAQNRIPFIMSALHAVNLVSAFYLLSIPEVGCDKTPGFIILCNNLTPSGMSHWWPVAFRFWAGVGAVQLVAGVALSATLQPWGRYSLASLLSKPLSRYLGSISYSLYCIHGITNHTFGIPIWYAVFEITDRGRGWYIGYFISMTFQTVATVWLSDIFWRVVDMKSVIMAKRVEEVFLGWA